MALKSDGTVWTWGSITVEASLGSNTDSKVPMPMSRLTGVVAITAGWDHCLALKSDGAVWAWGYDGKGQLGNGSMLRGIPYDIPMEVAGLSSVMATAAGEFLSLALKNDGTVWAWGYNNDGQLGNGSNANSSDPVQVHGLADVVAISGGNEHSLGLTQAGHLLRSPPHRVV